MKKNMLKTWGEDPPKMKGPVKPKKGKKTKKLKEKSVKDYMKG